MPYCLSINTFEGIVLCASSYESKSLEDNPISASMKRFIWQGERFIVLLCSGNPLTIEAVLMRIQKDLDEHATVNLRTTRTLNDAADYMAEMSVTCQKELREKSAEPVSYEANFIIAGQILNQAMETLLIYAQGNYIHESNSSPFLQMGENKFGKPILDRIAKRETSLETAAHCALVSVDSTIRSNPSTKVKIELLVYKNNTLDTSSYLTLDENNDFLKKTSESWNHGITAILESLAPFSWE